MPLLSLQRFEPKAFLQHWILTWLMLYREEASPPCCPALAGAS